MTAGGLASLALIADRAPLSGPADAQRTQQLAIVRARQWLDRYFAARSPDMNLCQGAWTEVYGWWSIERAGYATGLRRFGRTHWLTVGSRRLLSADADGLWGKRFDETIDTSLALLFLKAGHRPRSFGKLLLADQQDQTPGDLRQLARQLSRMREELLGWEAIRLSENELADGLLEVPILLVSIDAPVRLSPRTRAALAEYVRRGGFLLVVTDPGDAAGPAAAPTPAPRRPPPGTMVLGDSPETADGPSDAAGFRWPADQTAPPETPAARAIARELDRALGPAGFMQAPLPVQHPLWRTHYNLQPLPATRQWSDGVTTRALLVYARLDRAWERGDPAATPQAFQLAANLLLYVADGRPLAQLNLARLQATLPAPLPRQRISLGSTDLFTIASLRHRGRWQAADLAPAGLARLAAQTLNAPAGWYPPVRANRAQLAGMDMLWLGGVDGPALSTVELAALEAYARAGGLIVASNPGGAGRFTNALEAQLATRPGWRIEPLAAGHPLLTGQLPGDVPAHDLRKMRLALLPRAVAPASPRAETPPGPPDLRALRYQGALVGILCSADLSYAAADLPCFGRVGYAREDTLRLVQNLIALARLPAGQRDGPPAPPR